MAEQQLDLIKTGAGRGGSRAGAGRKKTKQGSVVMRVPTAYQEAVKDLIALLDGMADKPSQAEAETEWRHLHTDTVECTGGSLRMQVRAIKF